MGELCPNFIYSTTPDIPITAGRVVTFRPGQKLKARIDAYFVTE